MGDTDADIDWVVELQEMHASLPGRLEALAKAAETADRWTDEERLMPAAGVADLVYEALDEIMRWRKMREWEEKTWT